MHARNAVHDLSFGLLTFTSWMGMVTRGAALPRRITGLCEAEHQLEIAVDEALQLLLDHSGRRSAGARQSASRSVIRVPGKYTPSTCAETPWLRSCIDPRRPFGRAAGVSNRTTGMRAARSGRWLPGVSETPNYKHVIPLGRRQGQRVNAPRAKRRVASVHPKPPSLRERALEFVRERGVVTTAELQAIGVHRCYLTPMCAEGLLVRVSHGRYKAGKGKARAA